MSPAGAWGFLRASFGVGVDVIELADKFLHVLAGIVDAALQLERAGVNTQKEDVAMVVGHDLEDQAQRGSFGSGLRFSCLSGFFGLVPTTGGRSSGLGR